MKKVARVVVAILLVLFIVFIGFIVVSLLQGCGGGGSGPDNTLLPTRFHGTVTDAQTKAPLEGVDVSVSGGGATDSGKTVAGKYDYTISLPKATPTSVTVSASVAQYEPKSKTVTANGGTTQVVDLTLTKSTVASARITGTVTDQDTGRGIAGAQIKISVAIGPLPIVLTTKANDQGQYDLTITLETAAQVSAEVNATGYESRSESFGLAVGEQKAFSVSLVKTVVTGTLRVRTKPVMASVFIDGVDSGKVTPSDLTVAAGNHTVRVEKSGYQTSEKSVAVVANQAVLVELTLTPTQDTSVGSVKFTPVRSYGVLPESYNWNGVAVTSGGTCYVSRAEVSIRMFGATGTDLGWFPTGWHDVEDVSAKGETIAVAEPYYRKIIFLDSATKTVLSEVSVPGAPRGLGFVNSGKVIYSTGGGRIGWLDNSHQFIAENDLPLDETPIKSFVDPIRETLWVLYEGRQGLPSIREFDLAGQLLRRADLPAGFWPYGGAKVSNKNLMLVAGLQGSTSLVLVLNTTGSILGQIEQPGVNAIGIDPRNGQVHAVGRDTPAVHVYRLD